MHVRTLSLPFLAYCSAPRKGRCQSELPHEPLFSIGGGDVRRGGNQRTSTIASPRNLLLYRWWGSRHQLPHETTLPIARESVAARAPQDTKLPHETFFSIGGGEVESPATEVVISGRLRQLPHETVFSIGGGEVDNPTSPRDPLLYRWWGRSGGNQRTLR